MEFEFYGKPHKKKHNLKKHWLAIMVGIFFLILSLLIYTSFYGNFLLTGNAIVGIFTNPNESVSNIEFDAKLTVPSLDIDGKFEKVELIGRSSNSYLRVGNQRFYLGNVKQNYLIFYDYDGKISFNSRNILEFKGKSARVTINGVSVIPDSKNTVKVNLNDSFNYDSLEIGNEVSISELSYKTSGTVKLNNENKVFNINDEEITIINFQGDILIENNEFILEGYVDGLDIVGDLNIHIEG